MLMLIVQNTIQGLSVRLTLKPMRVLPLRVSPALHWEWVETVEMAYLVHLVFLAPLELQELPGEMPGIYIHEVYAPAGVMYIMLKSKHYHTSRGM